MGSPRTAPSDAVIAQAQAGHRQAQDEVLTYLHPLISRQLVFSFGVSAGLDDAIQESLVAVLEALPGFRFRSRIETWALSIALRTARRQWRRREEPATGSLPEGVWEVDFGARIELRRLLEALDRLTEKKRQAFVLMMVMELTAAEAGVVLGTFANTAASRCRHACAELRELLTNSPRSVHQQEPGSAGLPPRKGLVTP